ncbi:hypothetical protein [Actinokineospora sp. UTMC 2448]|uniref:hypothetical protein n=1 Tax=Actinokineospora sp. UTMC 2448 TaxID=2268449 RepID=UPI0021643A89|nr:hypothetical protein [Actinokineospora sp. UTMC 2448]UVS80848.1 hypothetical protein Actkin_04600 [Actinokineospora sp. UTMC 2448]
MPGVVVHSVESGAVTATLMTEGAGSWVSYGADGSSLAVSGNGGAGVLGRDDRFVRVHSGH